jgi:hypothetical protein
VPHSSLIPDELVDLVLHTNVSASLPMTRCRIQERGRKYLTPCIIDDVPQDVRDQVWLMTWCCIQS